MFPSACATTKEPSPSGTQATQVQRLQKARNPSN